MDKKTNIILIGMPASGKSTVGPILADTLAFDYFDTDSLMEELCGLELSAIIERDGLHGFCKLEEETVAALKAHRNVISTGGSVVYGKTAMENLQRMGSVVYLNTRLDVLLSRMNDPTQRGVIRKPGQTMASLFEERHSLYTHYAEIIVNCAPDDKPPITTARILEKLPL